MFYEASQIENLLICGVCKERFLEPQLLPCGETICRKCIVDTKTGFERCYSCVYCKDLHLVPYEGFQKCFKTERLMNQKAGCERKDKIASELWKVLEEVIQVKEQGQVKCIDQVKNFCSVIDADIQQTALSRIEDIKNAEKDLRSKLANFEKKWVFSMLYRINNSFVDENAFSNEAQQYLTEYINTGNEVDLMQLSIREANSCVKHFPSKLLDIINNGQGLTFTPIAPIESLGTLILSHTIKQFCLELKIVQFKDLEVNFKERRSKYKEIGNNKWLIHAFCKKKIAHKKKLHWYLYSESKEHCFSPMSVKSDYIIVDKNQTEIIVSDWKGKFENETDNFYCKGTSMDLNDIMHPAMELYNAEDDSVTVKIRFEIIQ